MKSQFAISDLILYAITLIFMGIIGVLSLCFLMIFLVVWIIFIVFDLVIHYPRIYIARIGLNKKQCQLMRKLSSYDLLYIRYLFNCFGYNQMMNDASHTSPIEGLRMRNIIHKTKRQRVEKSNQIKQKCQELKISPWRIWLACIYAGRNH